MNYTRGEWIADIRVGMVAVHIDDKERFNCLDGAQDECIYVRHGHRGKDGWEVLPEDVANAHLIAAAPDLLEACEYAMLKLAVVAGDKLLHAVEWTEFSNKAKQAIAKAEGEK